MAVEWMDGVKERKRERVQGARRAILMHAEVTQNEGQTRGRKDDCKSGAKQLIMSWNEERKKIV